MKYMCLQKKKSAKTFSNISSFFLFPGKTKNILQHLILSFFQGLQSRFAERCWILKKSRWTGYAGFFGGSWEAASGGLLLLGGYQSFFFIWGVFCSETGSGQLFYWRNWVDFCVKFFHALVSTMWLWIPHTK